MGRGGSNGYHNLCFEQKHKKYQNLLSENFHFFFFFFFFFLVVKLSVYLNRHVFVMVTSFHVIESLSSTFGGLCSMIR